MCNFAPFSLSDPFNLLLPLLPFPSIRYLHFNIQVRTIRNKKTSSKPSVDHHSDQYKTRLNKDLKLTAMLLSAQQTHLKWRSHFHVGGHRTIFIQPVFSNLAEKQYRSVEVTSSSRLRFL
jgi:hypothetical protein